MRDAHHARVYRRGVAHWPPSSQTPNSGFGRVRNSFLASKIGNRGEGRAFMAISLSKAPITVWSECNHSFQKRMKTAKWGLQVSSGIQEQSREGRSWRNTENPFGKKKKKKISVSFLNSWINFLLCFVFICSQPKWTWYIHRSTMWKPDF